MREELKFAVYARSKADAEAQGREYAEKAGRIVVSVTAERFPNGGDYMVNWLATVECSNPDTGHPQYKADHA